MSKKDEGNKRRKTFGVPVTQQKNYQHKVQGKSDIIKLQITETIIQQKCPLSITDSGTSSVLFIFVSWFVVVMPVVTSLTLVIVVLVFTLLVGDKYLLGRTSSFAANCWRQLILFS